MVPRYKIKHHGVITLISTSMYQRRVLRINRPFYESINQSTLNANEWCLPSNQGSVCHCISLSYIHENNACISHMGPDLVFQGFKNRCKKRAIPIIELFEDRHVFEFEPTLQYTLTAWKRAQMHLLPFQF